MSSDKNLKTMATSKRLADFVLVGEVGCGKTTLMNALLCDDVKVRKTQSVVFHANNIVDTPGEFIGRPSYYGALLATIVEVSTIVYVQPANSNIFSMPAGLLQVYPDKRVIGVISKVDLPDADVVKAQQVLEVSSVPRPYFQTSVVTNSGINELRSYLANLSNAPDDFSGRLCDSTVDEKTAPLPMGQHASNTRFANRGFA